ncbi:uncharacterized protein LOC133197098 [Saccostrea echinata]|uniref:uncharacterized protein LOC133197098 n=1 Tax=Saccostrea echinata TaxID=191078 RepID=UPI002A7F6070|nr:uncharacterized protein LOC133197098 [Saccostrea echinata]
MCDHNFLSADEAKMKLFTPPFLNALKIYRGKPLPILSCLQFRHEKKYSSFLPGKTVRIGCASGFWGDTAVSAPQLIYGGQIDYLVFDYLAEVTMSLLIGAKHKNSEMGYAPDFISVAMAPFIKDIKEKGIKVISNAGGVNPQGCAAALKAVCENAGISLNIAVVTGDDLMPKLKTLQDDCIVDMQSGKPFPKSVVSMNAYLGAGPIARALELGADVVITGRCVDSSVVLGPLVHTFGWQWTDFNNLAAGSLAGHLVECGAQVTGGIFTDWEKVPGWDHIGFPIVECASSGEFIVTKPKGTGGLVTRATVSEQLLYEIGDPEHYMLPDVCCDFSQVQLEEVDASGDTAVHVSGAKGHPPTGEFKVCAVYPDGFRATAAACVGGVNAKAKAEKTAQEILKRCRRIFAQLNLDDFTNVNLEVIGSEHMYGPKSRVPQGVRDALLWLAVHHKNKKALEFFAKEIAPAGTGMAPGLTNIIGGRPRVNPVLKLFSFLYPRSNVQVDIQLNGEHVEQYQFPDIPMSEYMTQNVTPPSKTVEESLPKGDYSFRLEELAYTRSGDKGNSANIGVIARHPDILPYLRQAITPETVEQYFSHLFENEKLPTHQKVQRYDVPGVWGLNFVLQDVLGGGGIASLRSDPQGKAMGQMLLDFEIKNVPNLVEKIEEKYRR